MIIPFKKVHPAASIPQRGSEWAAGFDLVAVDCSFDTDNQVYIYRTGLAVEIPRGYVGLLFPRSSIFRASLTMSNSVGVIDPDYRGEVKATFRKTAGAGRPYAPGERCVQLHIVPAPEVYFLEKRLALSETERGQGGFGSSGR